MHAFRAILFGISVILSSALLVAACSDTNVGGASAQTRLDAMCKVMEVACSDVGHTKPAVSSNAPKTQDPLAAAFAAHVKKHSAKAPGSAAQQQKAAPINLSACPEGYGSCLGECSQYDPSNWEDGGSGAYAGCVLACFFNCVL
ncbi:hypothetical protein JR316_0010386 [Psilocybe cubensis]|uniref:Uncharacterized protein n=2 Tax=Psilocybe cubensis TaxID=181762 RepID=A0ACB8GLX7_PSICU|nr:hypothetical protein JR316_0010386 [Psilocybe cubensis]KAH9476474.1 hypothetical protein JR316_0010386 [Psilocybe cubensis]